MIEEPDEHNSASLAIGRADNAAVIAHRCGNTVVLKAVAQVGLFTEGGRCESQAEQGSKDRRGNYSRLSLRESSGPSHGEWRRGDT